MGKEYTWTVGEKEISCQEDGNKYFIYEGDKFITTVYKKMFGIIDEEIELGGVTCRFVVLNEKPDVAVDGTFLDSGENYAEKKEKRRKNACAWAAAEIVISLAALAFLVVFAIINQRVKDYVPAFAAALIFCVFGVWEMWSNRRK